MIKKRLKNNKGRIIKDCTENLAKGCQVSASYLCYTFHSEPRRFVHRPPRCFRGRSCSPGLPATFGRRGICPSPPPSWGLPLLALVFGLGSRSLLTSGSSQICSLLSPHVPSPSPSSLSPCHHLFSITLLPGWLMLETFQEFLIENTMRTVITSVSPAREPAAWGGRRRSAGGVE